MARQCVFCGSVNVLTADSRGALVQPDGFLPFRVNEQDAEASIGKAQRSTLQRLWTWWSGSARQVTELRPVYLPFWVFDGFVEVRSPGASRFDRLAPRVGLPESGSPVKRDLLMFDNLVYSGMDFPPSDLLGQILPFELKALVPYEARLLADWPAALYHRDVEEVVEIAYDAMLSWAVLRSGPLDASSAAEYAKLRRTFQVTSATYQLVLLPVWAALAQREDRFRLVLVNGQTGKVALSARLLRHSKQGD
jgi:hypothetical protein